MSCLSKVYYIFSYEMFKPNVENLKILGKTRGVSICRMSRQSKLQILKIVTFVQYFYSIFISTNNVNVYKTIFICLQDYYFFCSISKIYLVTIAIIYL